MALSAKKKAAITVGVIGAIGFIAFAANAADDDDAGGECPEGFIRLPDPNRPGQFICMRAPTEPPEEPAEPDEDFDDPLPPKGNKCNYSGCGAGFDSTHKHPSYYAQRIQLLGYPINAAAIAQNGSLIAVEPARNWVRQFQQDSNDVHDDPPAPAISPLAFAPIAAAPALSDDGLVGPNTIAAIERAHKASLVGGMPWLAAVELSG